MHSYHKLALSLAITAFFLTGCATTGPTTQTQRTLDSFKEGTACYDRKTEPYTAVVDSHLHYRPFGGEAVPFNEVNDYLRETSVRFVNVYGIGQMVPIDSDCTYYLNCPGTPVLPTIRNDFANAANIVEFKPKDLHLTLSMTFTDLANPAPTLDLMKLYEKEYPGLFRWMGEVNLIKQALANNHNHHHAASPQNIHDWADFMAELRARDIPINIHSDLGSDQSPTEYLHLMEQALELYPDNKIVWAHMGLSKELQTMKASEHLAIMQRLLDQYPKLMLDISWRVLDDYYFSKPEYQSQYVEFFNNYSDRILPGTDFVASEDKTFAVYEKELEVTSRIHQHLNDDAFRNIALGENYFRLLKLDYQAPAVCQK